MRSRMDSAHAPAGHTLLPIPADTRMNGFSSTTAIHPTVNDPADHRGAIRCRRCSRARPSPFRKARPRPAAAAGESAGCCLHPHRQIHAGVVRGAMAALEESRRRVPSAWPAWARSPPPSGTLLQPGDGPRECKTQRLHLRLPPPRYRTLRRTHHACRHDRSCGGRREALARANPRMV